MTHSIEKSEHRGVPVARLTGDIDSVSWPDLSTQLLAVSDASTRCLIVDLSGVTYIDSDSMGCLIEVHRSLEREGGKMGLVCCNPPLEHLLEETGLSGILGSHGSLDEAVDALPACRPA